jgi:hypothetical protein
MSKVSLADSTCRIQQAQEVLSLWLEATNKNDSGDLQIGAIISLLDGIPELMDSAEDELAGMDLKARDKA